jgi:hypothetical protein
VLPLLPKSVQNHEWFRHLLILPRDRGGDISTPSSISRLVIHRSCAKSDILVSDRRCASSQSQAGGACVRFARAAQPRLGGGYDAGLVRAVPGGRPGDAPACSIKDPFSMLLAKKAVFSVHKSQRVVRTLTHNLPSTSSTSLLPRPPILSAFPTHASTPHLQCPLRSLPPRWTPRSRTLGKLKSPHPSLKSSKVQARPVQCSSHEYGSLVGTISRVLMR